METLPTPDASPAVIAPRGALPPQKQAEVLRKLDEETESSLLSRHIALVESVGGSPLITGNRVKLLVDAPAAYEAMFQAMREARDHINIEVYLFADDEIGTRFADLLLEKRASGVQVNVLYDSVGCRDVPDEFFQRLRDGGVKALEFNPTDPSKTRRKWLLTERDHRKILIVDGKVAFMGGINIAKVYSEGSGKLFGGNTNLPWRDTHVRIEGPAVAEIQKLFLEAWAEQHGPKLESGQLFPRLDGKGDDLVQVVGNRPGEDTPKIYFMYFANIAWAERTVYLTNPYFVPDDRILDALKGAARRGVDVRILLPGSSDIGVIFYAGRSFYTELLKAGVRLYERKGVLLHAKTAVIDGVWSTVGSTNLEMWSFTRNFEANTIILNPGFAFEMEQLFFYDLADSKEVRLEEWERRPARERVKEWFIRRFRHWL